MNFQQEYANQMFKLKDDCLRKVVQQVLGRETFEDSEVKEFEIIIHTEKPGREFIGYKGNLIGEIVMFSREEEHQWKAGFEFIPKTTFD